MGNDDLIIRIKNLYQNFTSESMNGLGAIYHEDVTFIDPFHTINSIDSLHNYFINLSKNLKGCRFEFISDAHCGDHVFLEWIMTFSHPAIESGKSIDVHGTSVLTVDGKITHHRDYFDSGEMLFKHLPIFKQAMAFITRRMAS